MEACGMRVLRGPNLWCRQTVLESIVRCPAAPELARDGGAFENRVRARFPEIDIVRAPGRDAGSSMVEALAFGALRLQSRAGCAVSFACTRPLGADLYRVVVEYSEEEVGRLAFEQAWRLCEAAREDQPYDLAAMVARLRERNDELRLGPSTASIVLAAMQRDIPFRRLTEGSLVQLGWGSRQRRIQAAETDCSSAIAESIAQDKALTKDLLAVAGVKVPPGRCVADAADARAAALELGGAVVVKPRDGNQGKGVTVNIQAPGQVEAAYRHARQYGRGVMVERYFPGHDFRLLVVGDALVAAARRDPPQVIGDGGMTIRGLVDQINADPARGEGHGSSLTRIVLDEVAIATLAAQGFGPDSVPAEGVLVKLRNNANLSTGGTATDVTDHVHPEVAAMAVAAAQMVGLDVCGIDFLSASISEPLDRQRGCIVEVNAAPGLRMHLSPSFGRGRAVGEAIVRTMFPEGETGRIPLIAVTGVNGKTTTVRLIAHLLASSGLCVGMANSDGVYIGGRIIDAGDCSGPRSARNVLLHPDVDAAVLETARGGILREGLGFDRCHVAVVTNIGSGDHLGLGHLHTLDELAAVKRVIVENVASDGMAVLNADDPLVAAMGESCPGAVTFFSTDRDNPVIAAHRAKGRRIVVADQNHIRLIGSEREYSFALQDIGLTLGGRIPFQVQNAMAAIAAVWALGMDLDSLRRPLACFASDAASTPGRFNLFSYRGATVIADYGHNPDAITALVEAVERMPAARRWVVISGAGDRRDEDLRRQTEILGAVFDGVVLYEDMCQRGRAEGEVVALLRQGLSGAVRARVLNEIKGERAAMDWALDRLEPGDLCLILVDQVEESLRHIAARLSLEASGNNMGLCANVPALF